MARGKKGMALTAVLALSCALGLGGCSLPGLDFLDASESTIQTTSVDSSALIETGTLTVAIDTAEAPLGMKASDGSVTGYEADVARAIAQRFGLSVTFVDSANAETALTSGTADIYVGASSSDSTKIQMVGNVIQNASAIFAKSSDASAVSATALASATVGVQASSASQDALTKAGINATQQSYSNVNECFAALENGEVQYVACDLVAGAYLARAYSDISFAGIISSVSTEGVAVRSNNSELTSKVQSVLSSMSADGTLEAIHTMWFGDAPSSLDGSVVSGVTLSQASATEESTSEDTTSSEDTSSLPADEQPISTDINDVNR